MATPSVRSYSSASGTLGSIGFSVSKPAGVQAGDVLLIHLYGGDSGTNTPTGFTVLASNNVGGANTHVFQRLADGTEAASVTFTDGSGSDTPNGGVAVYLAVQGATGLPEATSAVAHGTTTTATASSVNSLGSNRLLVAFFAASTFTSITPSGGLASITGTVGSNPYVNEADKAVGSGATGSQSATLGGSVGSWDAVLTVIPGSAPAGALPRNVVVSPRLHPSFLE